MISKDHPIVAQILSLIPINSLDQPQQEEVLAAGEVLEFKRRRVVFESGTRDPYTFYLVSGQLELEPDDAAPMRMGANDPNALRALAQLQPRRYTARTLSPVQVFRIERAALDRIMTEEAVSDHGGSVEVTEIDADEGGSDWMSRLLNSELFTRLPHDNIQRFFAELEPLEVEAGSLVVEQGTPGDYLYIVAEGLCEVVRRVPGSGQEIKLGALKEGDTFGEESLISNTPRNASVRMVDGGVVMRLSKRSFEELVRNPTLKAVTYSEACKLVEQGAMWLDVRFKDEHELHAIEGSVNAPLNALRLNARNLDRPRPYVVYCDSGARSSTGAFLLARMGFDACYLAGGLDRSPLARAGGGVSAEAETDDFVIVRAEPEAPAESQSPAAVEMPEHADTEVEAPEDTVADADAETLVDAEVEYPEDTVVDADADTVVDGAGDTLVDASDDDTAAVPPGPPAVPVPDPAEQAARAARAAQEAARAAEQQAQIRAQFAALKAERDRAVQMLERAATAARELKRRYEELQTVAQAENARREELEREVAATKAEAERQLGLERARLEGEVSKSAQKLEELQRAREHAAEEAERTRAELDARATQAERNLEETTARVEALEAASKRAEAALEDARRTSDEAVEAERARTAKAEAEAARLADEMRELSSNVAQARQSEAERETALESAVAKAKAAADAEREALATEREALDERMQTVRSEQRRLEEEIEKARAALEAEGSSLRGRTDALDKREAALADRRESAEAEFTTREQALADGEAALGQEKLAWRAEVDRAIAAERERLEADLARRKEEADRAALEAAESRIEEARTQFEEQLAEARESSVGAVETVRQEYEARLAAARESSSSAVETVRQEYEARLAAAGESSSSAVATVRQEYEARLAAAGSGVEAQMSELHEKYTAVIDATRRELETRLFEQEALLEDERRRLELENARLREALAESRGDVPAPVMSPYRAPGSEGEDTEIDLAIDLSELDESTPAPAPAPELDLPSIEVPMPGGPAQGRRLAATPESEAAPVIELVDDLPVADKDSDDRARVLSAGQLADIRRKMQEKIAASKRRAG